MCVCVCVRACVCVCVCGNPFIPMFPYNFELLNAWPFSKCHDSVAKQNFMLSSHIYVIKAFPE